jgi:phosphomannomutase
VKQKFALDKIDTQDGIRIDWENSWVHARPSNTEPIMRIIAEAPDRSEAEQRIAQVRSVVDATLQK